MCVCVCVCDNKIINYDNSNYDNEHSKRRDKYGEEKKEIAQKVGVEVVTSIAEEVTEVDKKL